MEVGLFEAKTHLSQLVERASRGEEITLTKRGKPLARIVPLDEDSAEEARRAEIKGAIDRILAMRVELPEGVSIRDLIEDGRM